MPILGIVIPRPPERGRGDSPSVDCGTPVRTRRFSLSLPYVGIGTSAGGLHALIAVLSCLPVDLDACLLVVQHLSPHAPLLLAKILAGQCALHVQNARDGDVPQAGHVYVAPPDRHLTVAADRSLGVGDGPPIHYARPSIDRLFISMAEVLGSSAVGVILSGRGVDGAAGSSAIRRRGGITIVQDDASAEHAAMPRAAIAVGAAIHVVPLARVAATIVESLERTA